MITSRDLEDLDEPCRQRAKNFVWMCKQAGIDVIITCTYRDDEAQDALYALGRTIKGRIVTMLRGGESKHNKRQAFDFAPLKHGKIDWQDVQLFATCGAIAENCGLKWAGNWKGKFKELCHCEI